MVNLSLIVNILIVYIFIILYILDWELSGNNFDTLTCKMKLFSYYLKVEISNQNWINTLKKNDFLLTPTWIKNLPLEQHDAAPGIKALLIAYTTTKRNSENPGAANYGYFFLNIVYKKSSNLFVKIS